MGDGPTIEVSLERFERMIDSFSLVAVGEYEAALAFVELQEEANQDRFALLEVAFAAFINDLADAREANDAHLEELRSQRQDLQHKLDTIERQQLAIRELSTPIIELWDSILTLPLVGVIDTQRALELTTQLLERITKSNARFVIIDVTGIDVLDTMTANHFIQMVRAARLLGTSCVITGVSPQIARTIVEIGIDLDEIDTLRSLKEGLVFCLRKLHEEQT